MSDRVTVVGARGFVGSAVAARARAQGADVVECRHDDLPPSGSLGTAIYCSGIAWGAERRPLEAYDLHVAAVSNLVRTGRCDRVVYLSSTRVYDGAAGTSEETAIALRSDRPGDVYPLSKAAGESAVLSASPENRVVRASNIFGPSVRSELFLSDILRQAARTGRIALRSSLDSSKDYVGVDDVAELLLQIGRRSRHRIYNVAAGSNTTHRSLLDAIAAALPVTVDVPEGAPTVVVPEIDVARVSAEFAFAPRAVVEDVPRLVAAFREAFVC